MGASSLRGTRTRRGAGFLVLGLAVSLLAMLWVTAAPARAADLRDFDPGEIISDQVFFDDGSMSPAAIQAFLDVKGAGCARGADGSACLKAYRVGTVSRAATTFCPKAYQGAAQESAATIIAKVAVACRVNPQVLLVTLQKEMGLVRTANPTAKMYQRAMGYGCPDNSTGVCDSAYYGLQNQLYSAASQYKRYAANPTRYAYRAGVTNHILYHPYNNCGRQSVYIRNVATAALYNYTPYVPNRAALNAGYGTGDTCSSYGNRNFFSYFTDWFGSTQSSGSGAINLKYTALGGASSVLGSPVAATTCGLAGGGCGRAYQNGSIYWSPSSGAAMVQGEVLHGWWSIGGVGGWLGYPVADSSAITGGKAGAFQGGSLYWSPATGAAAVGTEMLPAWWSTGGVTGPLGYPVASSSAVSGGKAVAFQGGSVYWSAATGGHWLSGDVLHRYWSLDGPSGYLRFPTSDIVPASTGTAAAFQGGSVYSSPGTGARAVAVELLPKWWATGGVDGPLGWPTKNTQTAGGGKSGVFQGGAVFWSKATGARTMSGAVLAKFGAAGGVGALGFPTADQSSVTGGAAVALQKASIYWSSATGARVVRGEVRAAWWARGGITGPLGFPTADTVSVSGLSGVSGQAGRFSGGAVHWSKTTGARVMSGAVLAEFDAAGGARALGLPIADQGPVTGGQAVALQGASVYWSQATGAHTVRGEVRAAWWARGGITGPLGFPTSDTTAVKGLGSATGQAGRFSGGALYWSKATGARTMSGAVWARFDAAGGSRALGFPIADQGRVTGGEALALQDASIYWSKATGAHMVRGEIRANWWARGGITGPLGFPTSDTAAVTGLRAAKGQSGTFRAGSIYWSAGTGARVLSGDVLTAYLASGGPAELGFPVADQMRVTGGQAAALEGNSIYWSAGTGAHVVRGAALHAFWAAGSITGALGFPTADTTAVTAGGRAGTVTAFQHGSVYATEATGARVVLSAVDERYRAAGGPASTYGWPSSDSYAVTGGIRNDFQSGQITG